MKKLAIIKSDNIELIESIKTYFNEKSVEITIYNSIDDVQSSELVVMTDFSYQPELATFSGTVLAIHPSLLPAFACSDAVKEAYTSGVKVTGLSVYRADETAYGKIIAQYPVLIGVTTTFCDLLEEIMSVSKRLYPVVINSVLNDTVFDFQQLFDKGCSSCCGSGCSGCKS